MNITDLEQKELDALHRFLTKMKDEMHKGFEALGHDWQSAGKMAGRVIAAIEGEKTFATRPIDPTTDADLKAQGIFPPTDPKPGENRPSNTPPAVPVAEPDASKLITGVDMAQDQETTPEGSGVPTPAV